MRALATSLLAVGCVAYSAQAQATTPAATAANRSLHGTIVDSNGKPIDNVSLSILKPRRQARTDKNGKFRIDSLALGAYEVSVRKVGFVVATISFTVDANDNDVQIRMEGAGYVLPSLLTTANLIGLSGAVADTTYKAMKDVKISVMGTGQSALTDSLGAFFIPLKAGQYMATIERRGYARQMRGVSISDSAGQKIAAWMIPQSRGAEIMLGVQLFDLNQKIMRSSAVSSKYFTREQLAGQGMTELLQLGRRFANGRLTSACDVTILGSGQPFPVALSDISVNEVEFVELYLPSAALGGSANRGKTSVNGNAKAFSTASSIQANVATSADCGNLAMIVWLRQ